MLLLQGRQVTVPCIFLCFIVKNIVSNAGVPTGAEEQVIPTSVQSLQPTWLGTSAVWVFITFGFVLMPRCRMLLIAHPAQL